jgi:hypothetical protein
MDDQGEESDSLKGNDKLAAELMVGCTCDTHPNSSCVVKGEEHVRLDRKDCIKWAAMIVSHRFATCAMWKAYQMGPVSNLAAQRIKSVQMSSLRVPRRGRIKGKMINDKTSPTHQGRRLNASGKWPFPRRCSHPTWHFPFPFNLLYLCPRYPLRGPLLSRSTGHR